MAADGGRLRTAQAIQACMICKTRKKKCNKALPSCGYCSRKELDCVYVLVPGYSRNHAAAQTGPFWGVRPPIHIVSSRTILSAKLPSDQVSVDVHDGQVYLEVHRIIRATGQFVEDFSARYFRGFHRHLPVISRTRFYNNLVTLGTAPAPDFSVLLLTICLLTYAPALGYQHESEAAGSVEQHSLYLTARSLFAQVQISCSPSVPLIQAGLLLAMYEYTHGRPDDAFATIAGSSRMAYAARIHARDHDETNMLRTNGYNGDIDLLLKAEEAANTWWGLIICERTFFSEVTVFDQPLVTVFPGRDARLPIEPHVLDQLDTVDLDSLPNIPVSCLTSSKIGGFSRTAQAICLLDQVFKSFGAQDIDSRLLQLDRLDTNIQAFLSLVMSRYQGKSGAFCAAINITIRALFTLHLHILGQHSQVVGAKFGPLEEWYKKSQETLDTVTQMVVDIADSLIAAPPTYMATCMIDGMPPMYPYIAYAALEHVRNRTQREDPGRMRNAEDVIQTSLDMYFQRWSVSDKWPQAKITAR